MQVAVVGFSPLTALTYLGTHLVTDVKATATRAAEAPGRLELVRAFVNTLDVESGEDDLSDGAALARWLTERQLLASGERGGSSELRRALAVREALRSLLVANNTGVADPDAAPILDAAARGAKLELRFAPDGSAVLVPTAAGTAGALGVLVAIVFAAMAAGDWGRLKACRAESCRRAFYDRSPSRSRTWCSMEVCGNRRKVRAYRKRRGSS
jgi:predicted RNA-binding Zn ribbon-like protein